MNEKIVVRRSDRILYPREEMSSETIATLGDLKEKLAEQDMVLSIFQTINGISSDVYRIIKDDYRKAFTACTEVKNKVSLIVMDKYVAEEGTLSWTYSSVDDSLVVYVS